MGVQIASNLDRQSEDVSGAKTLDAGDSGVVQNVTASATITLPATAVNLVYTIRNGGTGETDGAVTVTVSPNANDNIAGNGLTAADNKDVINTLGRAGDEITLIGNGVGGWNVASVTGTWTREA